MTPTAHIRPRGALLRSRRVVWGLVCAAALAAVVAGALRVRAAARLRAQLPQFPDLADLPQALRDSLQSRDRDARRHVFSPEAIGRLGIVYHANDFLSQAAACYRLATTLDSTEPRWPLGLAVVSQDQGDNQAAEQALQTATHCPGAPGIAWWMLAELQFKRGDLEAAEASYLKAREDAAIADYADLGLARIDARRQRWEAAAERLEPWCDDEPIHVPQRRLAASAYRHLGRTADADRVEPGENERPWTPPDYELLRELESVSCSSTFLLQQAALANWRGDEDRRGRLLRRAADVNPDDGDAQRICARWCLQRVDYLRRQNTMLSIDPLISEALERSRRAVALRPNDARARVLMAIALQRGGRIDEALRELHRALATDPDSADAHRQLALVHLEQNRPQEALPHARRATEVEAERARNWYILGLVYAMQDDADTALRHWFHALDMDKRDVLVRISIATALAEMGFTEDALGHLRAVLAEEPNNGQALALMQQLQPDDSLQAPPG